VLAVLAALAVIVVSSARATTTRAAGDRRTILPGLGVPPANPAECPRVTETQEAVILTRITLTTTENSSMAVNAVSFA
jgi:hypothetical protein